MNGFTFRFAVRMPNGDLYPPAPKKKLAVQDDYSKSSVQRDMESYGLGGYFSAMFGSSSSQPPQPHYEGPTIFETREAAEKKLAEIREQAQQFGIAHLGAAVVCQLCTPFTSGDPSIEFAESVVKWVAEQRMQP